MSGDFERYLRILGVKCSKPSYDVLKSIIQSHVMKVPFENISKLYYLRTSGFKGIPTLTQFLDGIEKYNFGGTCYSNNFHIHQLLKFLGYDVELHGADMKQPNVHLINQVKIDGREFIVDMGNAAPFFEPIPGDLTTDYRIALGSDEYVLSPKDKNGCSRMTLYRNGEFCHQYQVKHNPKRIEEFDHVIMNSYRSEATFMNCLLLTKFNKESSIVIHNKTQIESKGKNVIKESFGSIEELIVAIEKQFKIPSSISKVALNGLSMSKSAWV